MRRRRNFSREDVLTKTIPVFWKRGFADTKVEDLPLLLKGNNFDKKIIKVSGENDCAT
jgi:hypothetical protein